MSTSRQERSKMNIPLTNHNSQDSYLKSVANQIEFFDSQVSKMIPLSQAEKEYIIEGLEFLIESIKNASSYNKDNMTMNFTSLAGRKMAEGREWPIRTNDVLDRFVLDISWYRKFDAGTQ